ncbi:class I adenylate-forming enzyme family protein [Nocardia sp. alder85J]|uniref:class I adenylate-forming enzyme family protein n=1 Tax=Nocardia sp. alder85J TaxID=2862949 RepID=UPI001CD2AD8F|nr:fatty acid--CoA ligase family protein [Nocardia sp. alder85J]MCX4092365.1 fatty acid--CoA ligase family protein [Nocardia sp. alder85J]
MSVPLLLDMAAAVHGDRIALHLPEPLTFAGLNDLAGGGATLIAASGARHVIYAGTNGPAFTAAVFAAARAGVPITPLNYRLSGAELRRLAEQLPRPYIVADTELHAPLAGLSENILTGTEFVGTAAGTPAAAEVPVAPGATAVVLFTSGTTSAPKGVVLTHANLSSYVLQTVELGSAEPEDCALVGVPPYHVAGIAAVLTNTYAARRTVHLPRFTPADWLETVRAHGVTNAMLVPTMLARITEHLAGSPAATPTLRALSYGGARMPATVLERALAVFPDTGLTHAYGLTETSSTIAVLGPEDHRAAIASADPAVRARLGSVGVPVPGVDIEIRLPDGSPAPVGVPGELFVRGPQVSGGYVGKGSALDADGWFATRDRVWLDDGGYLFVEGRSDDTIIRGGENIAPAEIEDVLLRHEQVREAAVVGLPDEEWGERIAAVVVPVAGAEPDPEDLREWVRTHLRSSKTPALVAIRPELPYTPLGKLLRREVAADLLAARGPDPASAPGANGPNTPTAEPRPSSAADAPNVAAAEFPAAPPADLLDPAADSASPQRSSR